MQAFDPARATAFCQRFFGCAETALPPLPALLCLRIARRSIGQINDMLLHSGKYRLLGDGRSCASLRPRHTVHPGHKVQRVQHHVGSAGWRWVRFAQSARSALSQPISACRRGWLMLFACWLRIVAPPAPYPKTRHGRFRVPMHRWE